ncbi:hypothetical protein NUU61_008051 [Penicillium alfredii]|uniref:Ribosomal protein bL31m N-terminal domain-containing protein n=1 Tax=Penicillium alfredii TaxID=1506179 RepID=A0A9W9JYK5_9EURO|nr:uncharacterized protein NUU61_008051 [Penicillium alfredii]KAJ5086744.1 hypothetical protein NUU61_008051 [Penicillium alfredii]
MALHNPLRRTAATITNSTTTSMLLSSTPQTTGPSTAAATFICSQCRHATLLRRPKRPYTFTQLITLSDGSTFTHRTTSPAPVYRTTRDTRNSLQWNPSSNKLRGLEDDEAGRLAAFRARFGRSWDAAAAPPSAIAADPKDPVAQKAAEEAAKAQEQAAQEEEDNLLDLISSFGQEEASSGKKKKD